MRKKIIVVPYNSDWPKQFERESHEIKRALGDRCVALHHVGSTSISGLCAKSKIDIIAVVKDISTLGHSLEQAGYLAKGEWNLPLHQGFTKREPNLRVNLHVFEEGNPEIEQLLLFRDYLKTHPETLEEYAHLKQKLVKEASSHIREKGRFSGYNLAKNQFIKKVTKLSGFDGLCLRFCMHYDEWEYAKASLKESFDQNLTHFVLYKGAEMVGIAQLRGFDQEGLTIRAKDPKFESFINHRIGQWIAYQNY